MKTYREKEIADTLGITAEVLKQFLDRIDWLPPETESRSGRYSERSLGRIENLWYRAGGGDRS